MPNYTQGPLTVEDMAIIDQNREGAIDWSVVKQGDGQIIAKFWKEADAALFARAAELYQAAKTMAEGSRNEQADAWVSMRIIIAELSPLLSRDAGEGEG